MVEQLSSHCLDCDDNGKKDKFTKSMKKPFSRKKNLLVIKLKKIMKNNIEEKN
jgi:hypothetical protein